MVEQDLATKKIIEEWVDSYSDEMFSWVFYKTSNKEIAEDIVQETFMAAVQYFDKFEGKSSAKTWLFAILNNKIKDYYQAKYRDINIEDDLIFEQMFGSSDHWKIESMPKEWTGESDNLLDDEDFEKTLSSCMDKLPEKWSAALRLKFLEEKRGNAICQEMGIAATNFWQILHRAKLQLRKCLELNWFSKS